MAAVRGALGGPIAELNAAAIRTNLLWLGHEACRTVWRYCYRSEVGLDPTFPAQTLELASSAPCGFIQHSAALSFGSDFQLLEACFDAAGRLVHFDYTDAADLAARKKARCGEFDLSAVWPRLVIGTSTSQDALNLLGAKRAVRPSPGRAGFERWTFKCGTPNPRTGAGEAAARPGVPVGTLGKELTLEFDASGRLVDKWGWSSPP